MPLISSRTIVNSPNLERMLPLVALVFMIQTILASPDGIVITDSDFEMMEKLVLDTEFKVEFCNEERTAFRVRHSPVTGVLQ